MTLPAVVEPETVECPSYVPSSPCEIGPLHKVVGSTRTPCPRAAEWAIHLNCPRCGRLVLLLCDAHCQLSHGKNWGCGRHLPAEVCRTITEVRL